jgi:DNA primase catalytic core
MSLRRLTAGSGYDYLTRQVAAMDSSEKGHATLASYYSEKGEVPGRWIGSGMVGIDGLKAGDIVTAEQMQALFGAGMHPLAQERSRALFEQGASSADLLKATRLGTPYKVYDSDIGPFRIEVARRLEALNREHGLPANAPVPISDRARVRGEVALEMFLKEHRRAPLDVRELTGFIAKLSRQRTTAVAGFDLTFSPVKSVSALWALAEPAMAARIERAHQAAVADALRFIETHALYTRTGRGGVQQVDVRGLAAVAFTHRDSRAGDPDLHTHVAVANKVQTLTDGRWLSIDSRVLHKAIVAASETYNTALERHLAESLGVRFAERALSDPRKRPVREIVGVDPRLIDRWSTRRKSIEVRRRELVGAFQRDHGRPPAPVEAIALAEQATLETRDVKHEPRTIADQRSTWRGHATEVFGGERGIAAMFDRALHPSRLRPVRLNDAWVDATAAKVVHRVEQDRSVWQSWHLIGEAQRLARAAAPSAAQVPELVERVVDRAMRVHSIALSKPDPISDPLPLQRVDRASVYTIAGSQQYTSKRILDAEQRLVAAAGRRNGRRIPGPAVDLAILQAEADGVPLNPGQTMLVREMATSGTRVQLAIAPAGSGKTTAMNALARAWTNAGGTVLGLAPSAAAAATLGDQIGAHADTLAKLVWSLEHEDHPAWLKALGRKSLVIIDEAGMAGTLTLDTVISHVLAKGASVRLIGDNQQLAAIEAGGVLRDIEAEHGALRLTELVRFADQAEGSASLALRDGLPEALGFYLDNHRVHVGDETTMADDLFTAWTIDRGTGLDSIMLAPTRELVAELNQRARTQRLDGRTAGIEIDLADGNRASAGDVIITRANNRKLRTSATDWVKNGDRWTVLGIDPKRGIHARHLGSRRHITLPTDYVAESVELGYASTTHAAQGITADTMHGLLAGSESRQQAYTMLTRGRIANHSYLVTVGDGDPHNAIDPEVINPLTPTDLLERILGRDEALMSATTQLWEAGNPRTQLKDAVDRYSDAVTFAATHVAGDLGIRALERRVEATIPGLTDAAGWPALRSELLMVQADGRDPVHALTRAFAQPIKTAYNPASVLAWRVTDTEWRGRRGPLPWLPAVPKQLEHHPEWGAYLASRTSRINELADAVSQQTRTSTTPPKWLASVAGQPPESLIADVEVWRAAHGIPATDQRPTGDRQHPDAAARWQRQLNKRLQTSHSAALDEWGHVLTDIAPTLLADPFTPTLARRLSLLSASGIQARQLLDHTAADGPLPDDHAAAALWWRISRHVSPAVAEDDSQFHLATRWLDHFTTALGIEHAKEFQASPWWPSLVATIERGLQRGWALDALLKDAAKLSPDGHLDRCQAWVWRLSLLTDPIAPTEAMDTDEPPADLWDGYIPTDHHLTLVAAEHPHPVEEPEPSTEDFEDVELTAEAALAIEAMIRDHLGVPEPTDADIRRMQDRANAWHDCPATPERLAHINELATRYYEQCFTDSWARPYLIERFHQDLAGSSFRPGYAPAGWTGLVTHLRRQGVTDEEMLAVGVAATASSGRLIDRFRDRVVFPVAHEGQILGFVGRRNPTYTNDEHHGPKYLNTPDTPLYHKGAQLFAAGDPASDATPVLVEGPMDAIAVALATEGTAIGLAPLGTSLTQEQARQLYTLGRTPVIATDADAAGRAAAERDFWILTPYGVDPLHARLPDGADPADMIATGAPGELASLITAAQPLADTLIDGILDHGADPLDSLDALRIVAAQSASKWSAGILQLAEHSAVPASLLQSALVSLVRQWNRDPRHAAQQLATQIERKAPPEEVEQVRTLSRVSQRTEERNRSVSPRVPSGPAR